MKAIFSMNILSGNFGCNNDDENYNTATRYRKILEGMIHDFIINNYPSIEIEFDITIQRASGCSKEGEFIIEDEKGSELMQELQNALEHINNYIDRNNLIWE